MQRTKRVRETKIGKGTGGSRPSSAGSTGLLKYALLAGFSMSELMIISALFPSLAPAETVPTFDDDEDFDFLIVELPPPPLPLTSDARRFVPADIGVSCANACM